MVPKGVEPSTLAYTNLFNSFLMGKEDVLLAPRSNQLS